MTLSPSGRYQQLIERKKITADPRQQQALDHLDRLHHAIQQQDQKSGWLSGLIRARKSTPPGIYMWGGVGTGKTLLMDLFFDALPGGTGRRIHFHRFMQRIHQEKNRVKKKQNPLKIVADRFLDERSVLCLDEFVVTDITDAMIMYELLRHLFENDIVLVTTSNTEIENLYRDGLQRDRFLPAIDLLVAHTRALHVDSGNDYRMRYLQQDDVFHVSLNEDSNQAMEQAFTSLVDNIEARDSKAEINGRKVEIRGIGSGVAWFEFSALCQSHRSKDDYIEIARQFHTVLLSNIPALDRDSDDAARRLIEFIDEIYDRNVNLVASCAEPPETIYGGTRLIEPFKRTVSRLNEMRSAEYLARSHLA